MTIRNFIKTMIVGLILMTITYILDLRSIEQYEKDISDTVGKYDDIFLKEKYDRKYDHLCVHNIYADFYYENEDIHSSACVNDQKIELDTYYDFSKGDRTIHDDLQLIYRYDNNNALFKLSDSINQLVENCSMDESPCKETFEVGSNTLNVRVYNYSFKEEEIEAKVYYTYEKALDN